MSNKFDGLMGKIINIQHFSVDDGPGIRTTVFLKGCPLRCAWCHNPESQKTHREFLYRSEKCIGCGVCASVCPNGVHDFAKGVHVVNREACMLCGSCVMTCCADAVEIAGQDISLGEVMDEILADRIFYKRSGGGVTVSGGEPLAQADFTLAILSACRDEGIHTCVETCGYGKSGDLEKFAEFTDIFLFDYKLTDSVLHEQFTGVSNRTILENLDMLCGLNSEIILRCPMIPDVNMNEQHYAGIACTAEKYPNIREIHLEPYHPMGIEKANALGRNIGYTRSKFLDKSELTDVKSYISNRTSAEVKIL